MKTNKSVFAAYITVCILWGSTYLAMRIAVENFPPELFAGIRFLLAGAVVTAFAIVSKKAFPNNLKDFFKSAVPGIIMLMGTNGLVMWAEQWVHSGITSLLLSATPLFVAVIEVLIFRDGKMGIFSWSCLILGFIGTALLIVSGSGIGSIDVPGALLVLIAALLWSFGSIYSKKVKCSGDITTHIGIQMLSAGIGLTTIGILTGETAKVHINNNVIMSLAYLVIFGSIAGYSCNMYVLSKWPASKAITTAYINPVIAVILGVVLLGEKINVIMILCMGLTLGSVIMLHLVKYGIIKSRQKKFPSNIVKGEDKGELMGNL